MPPSAQLTFTYTSQGDIQALLSVDGETGSLDDAFSGTLTPTETAYEATQAINYASDRINFYCYSLYEPADLATSWIVNDWATIIACRWLRSRRGNPVPGSLQTLYDEAIKDLKEVRVGSAYLPAIGYRNNHMPGYSNVYKDDRYWLRKLRVERPLSDRQSVPTGYQQKVDRIADLIPEP